MMENGSEVYRVEDTMNRIAANAGEANSISYVTATGIFMGLRSSHYAQVENVHDRVINLEKNSGRQSAFPVVRRKTDHITAVVCIS